MGSLKDSHYDTESSGNFTESCQAFQRRTLTHKQWRMPRRYVIALMCFALLVIQIWKELNISFMLAHAYILEEEAFTLYPTIANWTLDELDNYFTTTSVTHIFIQMPAAILIFFFSGYKVLVVMVSLSAFLHILTPVCLQHHTYALVVVLVAQSVIAAPMENAVLSVWKFWAPPLERTKLVLFSFYGYFLGLACTPLYPYLFELLTSRGSYYFAGSCALVWSMFWYITISDTPSNDPLITESEFLYLEDNIPSDIKEKVNLRDVPWKSIIFSKPILALCLLEAKFTCSWNIIQFSGSFFVLHLFEYEIATHFFIGFVLSYVIFLPASTFLIDILTRKFPEYITNIRKYFICGTFILHAIAMLGVFSNSSVGKAASFCISYAILSISLPAYTPLALDLSPRYVSIIAGISSTFIAISAAGIEYFIEAIISNEHVEYLNYLYILDGLLTILVAAVFGFWGSAEEQPWSLVRNTIARSNDYLSYPKPEDEDDLKLVTDNV